MDRLDGRRVLLGVGASIAAYRACDLVRELRARGATVKVAPTKSALEFVSALTFEALSGAPILGRALEVESGRIPHVEEGYAADLAVVAPASADLMAKMAHGFADEGLLATLLSYEGPLVVAPAMESRMWAHEATRENVATLRARGALFVGPVDGPLASGRTGQGRLAPVQDIVEACVAGLAKKDLAQKRVVVTAGPTVEDIDPVRFISNRSSGKMGVAIARAAAQRGAHVTLVHGPLSVDVPRVPGLACVPIKSAAELRTAVFAAVERGTDVAILSAAVADFRPAVVAGEKIKKRDEQTMTLDLVRTDDTLRALGALEQRPYVVGFAAETNDVLVNARQKLEKKRCDLIVANDVSRGDIGFGSDENIVHLVTPDAPPRELPRMTKDAVADGILDHVARALVERALRVDPARIVVDVPRVVLSDDCGGYWCEHAFYVASAAARARGARVGFLHVPADDESFGLAEKPRDPLARHDENRTVVAAFLRGLIDGDAVPARVMLTGFGPFKTVVDNPSGDFVSSLDNLRALALLVDPDATLDVIGGAFPLALGAHADLTLALPSFARSLSLRVAMLPVDERAITDGSGTSIAELFGPGDVVLALGVASQSRALWRVERRATDVHLRRTARGYERDTSSFATTHLDDGAFVGALIARGFSTTRTS